MSTLEQVEGDVWPEEPNETPLMRKCRVLRAKDLDQFAVEDYRLLVGQGVGMPTLVPRVVALLRQDPLVGGDFYRGDLLSALLRPANWSDLKPFEPDLSALCEGALRLLETTEDESGGHLFVSLNEYLKFIGKT